MNRIQHAGRATSLRGDTPQQKIADGSGNLRACLLLGDDRVLVIDQRIGIVSGSEYQRESFIRGRAWGEVCGGGGDSALGWEQDSPA